MEYLKDFVAEAGRLLDHPERLDADAFIVYDIQIDKGGDPGVMLVKALLTFNKHNPLKNSAWSFDLDSFKYREIAVADAEAHMIHFLDEHLRNRNPKGVNEKNLADLSSNFIGGDWLTAFVNHSSISPNGCTFSGVLSHHTHESFLALIGKRTVRLFNCFEID